MSPSVLDGTFLCVSHPMFDLGEGLLDRVEVRGIGRKEPETSTSLTDDLPDGIRLVRAEIVHDDDISRLEGWHQLLLDIGTEALPVDRPVKHARGGQTVTAKSAEKGLRAPVAMRCETTQALAPFAPAIKWCHVGLDPSFIDEDQPPGIKARLKAVPALPAASDVGAGLLKGEQRFF